MITTLRADYHNPKHGADIVSMIRHYAMDPMGGGEDLTKDVQNNLVTGMAKSNAFTILAHDGDNAVGIANCFWGFSTFKARPLINIHDVAVHHNYRGKGIGRALFTEIETIARDQGACKITLEVLMHNENAKALYASLGYSGDYHFWQKDMT